MKRALLLIVFAGSVLAYSQTSTPAPAADLLSGRIKGVVTDQEGKPVAGATVYAVPQGTFFEDIAWRSIKTDRNGRFDFRGGFELEAYKLYARKDEDDYPDPLDSFYADSKAEALKVDLTKDPVATADVKLGERAGVLAGRVVDADTGTVLQARLYFYDEQGHFHSVESGPDGRYRVLLPPGKDVSMMVRVKSSSDVSRLRLAPLRLEPEQYVYMDIPLPKRPAPEQ